MSYIKVSKYYNEETKEYYCEKCYYNTYYKCNMIKHLKTKKHENSNGLQKVSKSITKDKLYECECGRSYKYRQGLYLHRKKNCNYETHIKREIVELKNLILKISEQNGGTFINKSNITNSFNNKNEIKIFLTEHCVNALSIQEFIKKLTITIDDINTTKDSNIGTITSIIERNLKPLSITARPIHYIENDEWYLKDKEQWKEDNGDEFINNAYNKYQNECLVETSKIELTEDDYINVIHSSTKELNNNERIQIKNSLKKDCKLLYIN